MNFVPIQEIKQLAKVCVDAISETLVTEARDVSLPGFHLDKFQQRLIDSRNRLVRVVAPAGSGKTRSLTAKAAHVLASDPSARILCLTFTNAAVNELDARLRQADGFAPERVVVSTINSFGYELLRKLIPRHRLISRDSLAWGGACALVQRILDENPFSGGQKYYQRSAEIIELADLTKSFGFGPNDTPENATARYQALELLGMSHVLEASMRALDLLPDEPDRTNKPLPREIFVEFWIPFWTELVQRLWSAGYITFEDQKYRSSCLLTSDPRAQAWLRSQKLTHVMVDEFQDINYLDLALILQITILSSAALFIVGDDDQCIYEWRGCSSHFIREPELHLGFLSSGSTFETILLEQNYRCPRNVVEHASRLIAHNQFRIPKKITAVRKDDANIRLIPLPAAYLTMHVVDELVAAVTKRYPNHTIAILGRKKSQLLPLQILFNNRGTKFYIDKDLNVFLGDAFADFRNIIAVLSTARKPYRPVAHVIRDFFVLLHRLQKHRVSKAETTEIDDYLTEKKPVTLRDCVERFANYPGEFKRGTVPPARAAEALLKLLDSSSVVEALQIVSATFKSFARDFLKSREDIFYSDPPFSHLADLAADYDDRFDAFVADLDRTRQAAQAHSKRGQAKVELLTALRGKGREFDTVIMLDVNAGIWPNGRAVKEGLMEEERRLFYVAVSRAKSNLLMFESGRVQGKPLAPSPFLAEMELPASAWLKHPEMALLSKQLLATVRI